MPSARTVTDPEKKMVAARQGWRCSNCEELLPSAFQVDHTVPLCDGGEDTILNATAMCPNCHAAKTQREHIDRKRRSKRELKHEDRTDYCVEGGFKCSLCFNVRSCDKPHSACRAIDTPNLVGALARASLSRFAFVPKFKLRPKLDHK
jgi:hypothetical protein